MATGQMSEVILHLRRAALHQGEAGLTDAKLLGRFVEHRDEAAVAALVQRHGPMVWGVCRRLLVHHDAEDAFQATFLVLARKASSIQPRETVAHWLHGVALRTARKAQATAARRRGRERQVADMPEPAAAERDLWCDLRPLLDEELSLLPDRYRAAIVLCDLEGRTRRESAGQLGVPEGTLSGWLTRGRAMLARRLARRGLGASGGVLAALLSQNAASAGTPVAVMSSTITAASQIAAGHASAGLVSAPVAALSDGVLEAMLLTKLKSATAVLLTAVALTAGAMLTYHARAAGDDPRQGGARPITCDEAPKQPAGAPGGGPAGDDARAKAKDEAVAYIQSIGADPKWREAAERQKAAVKRLGARGGYVWQYEPNRLGARLRQRPREIEDLYRRVLGDDVFSDVSAVSITRHLDDNAAKKVIAELRHFGRLKEVSLIVPCRDSVVRELEKRFPRARITRGPGMPAEPR